MADMEIKTYIQIQQTLISFLLGAIWAVFWEFSVVFCAAYSKVAGWLRDAVLVIGAAISLLMLIHGLGEGQMRLYMLMAVFLGCCVTHEFAGEKICRLFYEIKNTIVRLLRYLWKPLTILFRPAKKVKIFLKNLYAKAKNWFTIKLKQEEGTDTETPFLRKGMRSGATRKVSDRRDFVRFNSLRGNGSASGGGAASSGRGNPVYASAERPDVVPEHSGTAIRYE